MEDAILKLTAKTTDGDDDSAKTQQQQRQQQQLTITKLESMAILIYESMSISTRNYHSVQHIFDISQQLDDPVAILAACFHDCIYYHVDGGLTPIQAYLLAGTYDDDNISSSSSHQEAESTAAEGKSMNSHSCNTDRLSPPKDKPNVHDSDRTGFTFRATKSLGTTATAGSVASTDNDPATGKEVGDDGHCSQRHLLLLQMVESIFGYQPNQVIHVGNGLNEFLSAVIAVRELSGLLSIDQLAQIACCIEATIPFRPVDKDSGKTHMDRLYDRMVLTARKFQLKGLLATNDEEVDGNANNADKDDAKFTYPEIVKCIQRACILSNCDVGNFGTTDRFWFLDNTWSLLPETNESLRNQFVYSVQQFHHAMKKMYDFFGFLQPEVVFHQFRNVPSKDELDRMINECRKNLEFGKTYVAAKLLAMSLVAALAVLTGGDGAPLSLFTGDLTSDHHHQLENDGPQEDPDLVVAAAVGGEDRVGTNPSHNDFSTHTATATT